MRALLFILSISIFTYASAQVSKIAFGSCADQKTSLDIYDLIVSHSPDLFIFLGDNVYGDSRNADSLAARYKVLASQPAFQNLKRNVPVIATWDDHDYGENDAGKKYPLKKESKEIFLDFFEEPGDSERRKHEGIYTSYYYEQHGKILQVILLDCRTFRDDLRTARWPRRKQKGFFYKIDYFQSTDYSTTMLGVQQWSWLEKELLKKADLRIICSSTPFGVEYNGYEAWPNMPHEENKMFGIIRKTKADGVIFLSGDVHFGEISRRVNEGNYPIYDFTSSGLSQRAEFPSPNKFRIEGPVMENHFGLLTIDWQSEPIKVRAEIYDHTNNQRIEYTISKDEISFDKKQQGN